MFSLKSNQDLYFLNPHFLFLEVKGTPKIHQFPKSNFPPVDYRATRTRVRQQNRKNNSCWAVDRDDSPIPPIYGSILRPNSITIRFTRNIVSTWSSWQEISNFLGFFCVTFRSFKYFSIRIKASSNGRGRSAIWQSFLGSFFWVNECLVRTNKIIQFSNILKFNLPRYRIILLVSFRYFFCYCC